MALSLLAYRLERIALEYRSVTGWRCMLAHTVLRMVLYVTNN